MYTLEIADNGKGFEQTATLGSGRTNTKNAGKHPSRRNSGTWAALRVPCLPPVQVSNNPAHD
ncbi:hypothetical protein [Rufibacter immobilis]|uniref:hypothetical protein n=1 Tax=Rufibacter immobilis TaxID=1348778 RepID=UPI0035E949EF